MINSTSNSSKIMKGISSQTLVTIVLGVVEIVSFSIMSRLLTKDDFGYYAAITAITTIFSALSETGIGSAIVQQKELSKRYVNNAFTVSFIFGSLISLILLMSSGALSRFVADETMKIPLMLMSATLLLHCLTSVNISLMHRKMQFLRIGLINLISLVATTLVAIYLAYSGYGYYAIIAKAILSSIITYFLSLYFCKTRFNFAFDINVFKKIFKFSGWLMLSALFRNLSHQIDRILMPRLLSITALGAYNRPKDFITQISTKINGIFDSALFPVLSGLQDDKKALSSAFSRSLYLLNIFALLLTLSFIFNSGLIIRIFFGEEWLYLQPIFVIVSTSLLFNVDGRLSDCYLRSLAMTKQQFFFRVFETILKLGGILIGFKWGIFGVAVSVAITNLIANLIKILYVGKKIEIISIKILTTILYSWKFALLLLPICILIYNLMPKTLIGDVIVSSVFVVSTLIVFLFMPKFLGQQYYNEIYIKFSKFLKVKKTN